MSALCFPSSTGMCVKAHVIGKRKINVFGSCRQSMFQFVNTCDFPPGNDFSSNAFSNFFCQCRQSTCRYRLTCVPNAFDDASRRRNRYSHNAWRRWLRLLYSGVFCNFWRRNGNMRASPVNSSYALRKHTIRNAVKHLVSCVRWLMLATLCVRCTNTIRTTDTTRMNRSISCFLFRRVSHTNQFFNCSRRIRTCFYSAIALFTRRRRDHLCSSRGIIWH